ncbi:MAG: hypothetical protein ACNI3C_09585 [Candidatus Marinarcus sp.]|uniref:hypothetical protein n=1 Tax=Candidatus Marinarcus sp. TaxID=3100987 RepID=UPI003B004F48
MVIENSQVGLYSQTQFTFQHSQRTSVQLHYGEKNNENNVDTVLNMQSSYSNTIQYKRAVYEYTDNLSNEDRIKKLIIEILLGRLYGNKTVIQIHPTKSSTPYHNSNSEYLKNPYSKHSTQSELKAMVFTTQEQYYQKQTVDFSASVKIQTPNKSYDMNIDLSFSQELYQSKSTQMIIGDENFIDPLVINYGEDINPFENISKLHFAFDLDNDGSTEMIPQLKQGAGFLALDKNENGKIDNGSELFGPSTNNGFAELAQYDSDQNNWIDENDTIFDKLKIWSIDENGKHSLVSLLNGNVGAIYLGDVQSGFKYQSAIDQTEAVQKSNGVFVKEDGSGIGIVNSIDVVA